MRLSIPLRLARPAASRASGLARPAASRATGLRAGRQTPPCRFLSSQPRLDPKKSDQSEATKDKPTRNHLGRWLAVAFFSGAVYSATGDAPAATDDGTARHRSGAALNADTFVPWEVVARESVSPTSFVLTLRLPRSASDDARAETRRRVQDAWDHGLWSVEVRQPQLQIARDYTPLPSFGGVDSADDENSTDLRLFVRTVPGGEVSRYLAQRSVGTTVDVRGPRLSFDVASRAGARDTTGSPGKLVVLAAGTGIATALQAAAALAKHPAAYIAILWANRGPQDALGLDTADTADPVLANPVVRDLRALQKHAAGRVRVASFVDAENTHIAARDVRDAVGGAADDPHAGWRSWLSGWTGTSSSPPPPVIRSPSDVCVYHARTRLPGLDADPARGSARALCQCQSRLPGSSPARDSLPAGADLVLVSGPDGFVATWAGPKAWTAGRERQGDVGGVLGAMQARGELPAWQILKL